MGEPRRPQWLRISISLISYKTCRIDLARENLDRNEADWKNEKYGESSYMVVGHDGGGVYWIGLRRTEGG